MFKREKLGEIANLILNPHKIYNFWPSDYWYFSLFLPAFTFMLFFIQVGLDRIIYNLAEPITVVALMLIGMITGAVFCMFISGIVFFILKILKKPHAFFKIIPCVASIDIMPCLILIIGILLNLLLKWSTSLTFGLTALLCSLILLAEMLKGFFEGKSLYIFTVITVVGVLLTVWLNYTIVV